MNLQTYFIQQGNQRLSDDEKFLLYQKIASQRTQFPHSLKRTKILTKRGVYAFLATLLVFVFFGTFLRDSPEIRDYRAFFAQSKLPGFNVANANQVAEILELNGDYIIEKDGKQFKNSVLFDGDIITLKADAKVIFNINEHIKAEITGPAKFMINKTLDDQYRLYLMDGDSLKLEGQKDTDALQVETQEMMIETSKNDKIALEITKTTKQTQLKNTGDPLLVKNKKSKTEQTPTKLETAKLLTMQEDDIAKISDVESFTEVLTTKKNLTRTVNLAQNTLGIANTSEFAEEGIALLANGDTSFLASKTPEVASGAKELIASEIKYQNDAKKIPTEKQLGQITAALNGNFLLSDIQNLYEAKQSNTPEKILSAYNTLLWRLKSIGDMYAIEITLENAPKASIGELDKLYKELQNYHLPPAKLQQLLVLKNWLVHLQSYTPTETWEQYVEHLPADLNFK